ncbi:MAG: hypothetical protein EPN79_15965 [Burkholderiaceae bacterium]|nr:MAG: hypothetical protein EPN79_15965 [Burkholderiaceae bacterium]
MIVFLADPTMVDASTMLGGLMQAFPSLVRLTNLIASLAGLSLLLLGIFKFTQLRPVGDQKLVVAVMWVVSGVCLLNLASSVQSVLMSLFGGAANVHNLLAYQSSSDMPDASRKLIQTLTMFAQLYGLWAAIKGIMTLRHVGDSNHREGNAFASGAMKLVFGCLLLNIVQTVTWVANTLHLGSPLG